MRLKSTNCWITLPIMRQQMRQGWVWQVTPWAAASLCLSGERGKTHQCRSTHNQHAGLGVHSGWHCIKGMTEELKSYGIIEKEEDLKEFRNLAEKSSPSTIIRK